ncbi:hypothetical protein [Stenotrophomonas sp. PSU-St19]
MERERPDYLPPIQRSRWNFPWLITGFLTLLSLGTIGVLMLGRTNSAWNQRFLDAGQPAESQRTELPARAQAETRPTAADLAEIRARREQAEATVRGGWENLPGSRCGEQPSSNVQCFAGKPYRQMAADGGWVFSPRDRCP